MPEEPTGERLTFTERMTRKGEQMRAHAAASGEANAGRIETGNRIKRSGMLITGITMAMLGANGVVGAVLMKVWLSLLGSALMLVAAGLIIWLSRWIPPLVPDPATATLRRKARRTILGAVAAVLAALLVGVLSARLGAGG